MCPQHWWTLAYFMISKHPILWVNVSHSHCATMSRPCFVLWKETLNTGWRQQEDVGGSSSFFKIPAHLLPYWLVVSKMLDIWNHQPDPASTIPSWWINYWIFHVSTDPKIDVFSCGMGHLERFVRPWRSGPPVNYIISGYRICLPEFPVKLLNYVPTWRFRGNLGAPRNVLDNLLEPQHGFLLHCVALDHLHHVQVFPGAAVRDPWLKRLVIGEVPVVPELEEYLITSPVYMKRVNQEWMGEEGMKPHLYHLWDHLYPLVN